MKTTLTLPAGYHVIRRVKLSEDKRLSLWLNAAALLLSVGLVLVGLALHPLDAPVGSPLDILDMSWPQLLTAIGGGVLYIVLHELTHGVMIRLTAKVRPDYGLSGMFAYAGSRQAYFSRPAYLAVGLAPVVLWGIVLLVLNLTLPADWFWPVYFIQICNLGGAAGDLYITHLLLFVLPKDVLTMDTGVDMTFYSRTR